MPGLRLTAGLVAGTAPVRMSSISAPAAGEFWEGETEAVIFGWNLAGREEVVGGRLRSSSKMSVAEDTWGSEWLALAVALLMKVERGR